MICLLQIAVQFMYDEFNGNRKKGINTYQCPYLEWKFLRNNNLPLVMPSQFYHCQPQLVVDHDLLYTFPYQLHLCVVAAAAAAAFGK